MTLVTGANVTLHGAEHVLGSALVQREEHGRKVRLLNLEHIVLVHGEDATRKTLATALHQHGLRQVTQATQGLRVEL
jgi:hypothetical protein